MSKKKKGSPVTAAAPSTNRPAQTPPKPLVTAVRSQPVIPPQSADLPPSERPFELIRFDKRVKWFIGICVGLFMLLTLAKIHPASIAMWNQLIPDGSNPKKGLIAGEPRRIRMDDYAVMAPWILSQVNRGLPQVNPTIGGDKSPVLVTPSNHFSSFFRADYWGYFFLNVEQAYAWAFDFRAFFSIVGVTLMLLLFTGNNFWLSLFGGVWLFLSSGTQSWTQIPTIMIGAGSFTVISAIYLLFGQSRNHVVLAGLGLAYMSLCYAFVLYPPYQIPLAYLLLLMVIGYTLTNFQRERISTNWTAKIGIGAIAGAIIGFALYRYYADLKPTIDAITNTVYPGKRSELGGTGFIANWFSEYFSWQYKDTQFPSNWLNHCELSHYITFAPIIIPAIIVVFFLTKRFNWTLLLLSAFVLFGYVWIEIGFPEWLAKLSFWAISPTRRTQIPFGIGNVLLAVIYLHFISTIQIPLDKKIYLMGVGIVGVVAFISYAVYVNINDSAGFFKAYQLVIPAVFFIGLGILLLPAWQPAYRQAIFGGAMVLFLLPNLKLNPVSKGLSPITDHVLYKTVDEIHRREPNAKWVVFGGQYVSYLVTATGVDLLSGVKYTPPRKIFSVLDPMAKRDSAYNRYAHSVYDTYIDPQKPDTVVMVNTFEDGYTVAMDPCSPRLKKLNVKYVIFDRKTQPVETRCMTMVSTLGTIQIYRINE